MGPISSLLRKHVVDDSSSTHNGPVLTGLERGVARRVTARGKFLYRGDEKLLLRGVTYGAFGEDGFPERVRAEGDLAQMAAANVNAVRTYTVPPRWFLDAAAELGVSVLVGLAWEQHVAFLDERDLPRAIEARIREGVRSCAGHPAVLAYAIGNEISTSIVRWHGRRRIERFLGRLCKAARSEDPGALVTYVNYPSTEYLDPPSVDVVCFNLFLEQENLYDAYLARLQNLAGNRPLLITEAGLDSRRHGLERQAEVLSWQARHAFGAGCAGLFVFAWTDEWHRGGREVEDWDFGLVDRSRQPKPALASVTEAYRSVPFSASTEWPLASVVVCTHNGDSTLGECLRAVAALDYPAYEVVIVDDGSTDGSAETAAGFGARLVSTANEGLASARNTGLDAAAGEIVVYTDDDAHPDRHWLKHLVAALEGSSNAAVGGPNVPPAEESSIARCVAQAPGGPVHVLTSDRIAEHIPGCNMAFRRSALESIGGFDSQFRVAGDDVDICWQLQRAGFTIGFSPGALVWHRPRYSIRAYLRQQYGYGKAEALLEQKWPEKYNRGGHLTWNGRVYGGVRSAREPGRRWRVYYGTWGSAPFQAAQHRAASVIASLVQTPEWYLVVLALAGLVTLGLAWPPLFWVAPVLFLAAGALVVEAATGASRASFPQAPRQLVPLLRGLTAFLFFVQPLARLVGRLRHGLSPWRSTLASKPALPRPRTDWVWGERWRTASDRLLGLEAQLGRGSAASLRGGGTDRWDLQVRGGSLGVARLRLALEEHGEGRQAVRIRSWPKPSRGGLALLAVLLVLAVLAGLDNAVGASLVFVVLSAALLALIARDCAIALSAMRQALQGLDGIPSTSSEDHSVAELPRDLLRAGLGEDPNLARSKR